MGQSKSKLSIIVCGLDNSGKTTIINYLKPEEERSDSINATVGYNVETLRRGKRVVFNVFDMGGSKKFRNLWESYYDNVEGIVFVVDATDSLRMVVAKDELQQMLSHQDFTGANQPDTASGERERRRRRAIPLLIFANKNDLDGAKTPADISQMLELNDALADRPFNIFSSCALKGTGIDEGFEWLQATMLQQAQENPKRK